MDAPPLPRRPLLVSHSGDPGGSNEVLLSLLRRRPHGVEPACVFLADGPAVAEARALGVPVSLVEAGPARRVWRAPRVVLALARTIRRHRADVVFAHVAKAHAYASVAAQATRRPYLWWQHDLPRRTPAGRLAARLPAGAVVCSSDFTAALQRDLGSRGVIRIHPGVEPGPPGPASPPRSAGRPVVGAVGRLRRYKRYELLLAAAPAILEAEPGARIVIAGGPTADREYPDELRALARSLGVDHAVELPGHVEHAAAAMGGFDVLVHTAELEPFGLAVAEALLHGVPVVATDAGGPAEIVRDRVDGLLVPVEDAAALARAVVSLLRDATLRERMGRAGAERVRADFSAERTAAEAWRLAGALAGGGSGAA